MVMSIKRFEQTLLGMFNDGTVPDPSEQIYTGDGNDLDTARSLNAAFLITLAGPGHPLFWEADVLFEKISRTEQGSALGRYCQRGRSLIWRELEELDSDAAESEEILAALALAMRGTRQLSVNQSTLLSRIPTTVAYTRCALDATVLFADGREEDAGAMLSNRALDDAAG
jgi:hypothetical protein